MTVNFFSEGHGLIKKIESLALCNDKGVEIVLRMLVLFIKGKIPVNNTPSNSGTVLNQVKDHIHHWIVGTNSTCIMQNPA